MSTAPASTMALKIDGLGIQFGGLKAVWELSLTVPSRQICGVIGPNGAGKTTLFNMLTGVYQPTRGSIYVYGHSLQSKRPHEITRLGMARTFQNIRLFKELDVLTNILIALDHHPEFARRNSWLGDLFQRASSIALRQEKIAKAQEWLKIFSLEGKCDQAAGQLPYGDQRRLEIVRALATGARILLLDEPAAGMNASETQQLMASLQGLKEHFGLTIILIEHDMKLVMNICENIAVLDYGVKIAEGPPELIQKHPQVIKAYLGEDVANGAL